MSCTKTYNTYNTGPTVDTGKVVTSTIRTTISFKQVQNMVKGDTMKIRLNRNGFEVREYTCFFQSATLYGGEQLIYCSIPGITIGSGDSGSPLFTKDGKVAGALCYGFTGDNNQFIARAIEDLLSISSSTKSGIANNALSQKGIKLIQPAYQSSGLTNEYITRFASRDKYNILSRYANTNLTTPIIKNTLKSANSISVIPGMSATVIEGYGDLLLLGATGTISYLDNYNNMYAFGHHYAENYSPLAAPVFIADTKLFVESTTDSYKSADYTDYYLGSMKYDKFYGVMFNSDKDKMYATRLAIKMYDKDSIIYNHTLANNIVSNYEYNMSAQIPSLAIYKNKTLLEGKYVKVTGKVITTTLLNQHVDNISFNALTSNVDINLNDVLNDKFSNYTDNIIYQTISLSLQTSTYADSVLVPIVKK